MKEKLPKVYANKITKEINNNEKVYVSNKNENKKEEIRIETKESKKTETKTITQKINEIINTKKYMYKIPVKIKTDKEEIITKIIGKNNTNIITLDNKLIKIAEIKEIEIYEEQEKNE